MNIVSIDLLFFVYSNEVYTAGWVFKFQFAFMFPLFAYSTVPDIHICIWPYIRQMLQIEQLITNDIQVGS